MADVNSNPIETDDDDQEEAIDTMDKAQDSSDSELSGPEAEPTKTPAKVKINFSHVHREYEVSVFFTRFIKKLVK